MKIAYAIDIKEKDDPYILTAEHALGSISATTNVGSYLVDTLTFREYDSCDIRSSQSLKSMFLY